MLTQETTEALKNDWFTFEEINQISDSHDEIKKWNVISEKEFWWRIYSKINLKMKEKCI